MLHIQTSLNEASDVDLSSRIEKVYFGVGVRDATTRTDRGHPILVIITPILDQPVTSVDCEIFFVLVEN